MHVKWLSELTVPARPSFALSHSFPRTCLLCNGWLWVLASALPLPLPSYCPGMLRQGKVAGLLRHPNARLAVKHKGLWSPFQPHCS